MITFTDAWRRATIHPNGTMTILAHKTSSIGWTVVPPAPTRIVHVDAGNLEFQPAGAHQVAALANLGHQLLQEIDAYRPGFLWTASPAEIVGALIEEAAAPTLHNTDDTALMDFLDKHSVNFGFDTCEISFEVPDHVEGGSVREIIRTAIMENEKEEA